MVLGFAALVIKRIKRTQEGRRFETKEGGRGNVERAQSRSLSIQDAWIKVRPLSGAETLNEISKCGDGFGGSKGTVARAVDKDLAQQSPVPCLADDISVSALILVGDQTIACGVQSQYGNIEAA